MLKKGIMVEYGSPLKALVVQIPVQKLELLSGYEPVLEFYTKRIPPFTFCEYSEGLKYVVAVFHELIDGIE